MKREKLFPCNVLSGIPKGYVLGPVFFSIFTNDIVNDLSSNLNLFADDCASQKDQNKEDSVTLQMI